MQKSLLQYLFLIWVVNRHNLLFVLPLSVVIISPSLAATTDSRFVSYRCHIRKRTKTPEMKSLLNFEQIFTKRPFYN